MSKKNRYKTLYADYKAEPFGFTNGKAYTVLYYKNDDWAVIENDKAMSIICPVDFFTPF